MYAILVVYILMNDNDAFSLLTDFTFTPWKDMGHGKQTRTVSYTIQLNYSIGPKSSQAVELQTCHKNPTPGTYFTVDTECSCMGIPYGNTFIVSLSYSVQVNFHYSSQFFHYIYCLTVGALVGMCNQMVNSCIGW